MISNKLLSKVLKTELMGYEVLESALDKHNLYHINYYIKGMTKGYFINIYELAHKCKEWARDIGFTFKIEFSKRGVSLMFYGDIKNPYNVADTEPEAIFKACEWILKQEPKND